MQNFVLITDTSTSIHPYRQVYTDATNSIIDNYKKTFPDGTFTFVTFNEGVTYHCLNKVAKDFPTPVELVPKGLTSLYDCLCNILDKMMKFYEKIFMQNSVAVIITDGTDTTSKLMKATHTALQIARCKARGWKFVFLGTTPEALQLGRDLGCNVCILYSTNGKSLEEVSKAVNDLVVCAGMKWKDADLDLRVLEESMSKMEIV